MSATRMAPTACLRRIAFVTVVCPAGSPRGFAPSAILRHTNRKGRRPKPFRIGFGGPAQTDRGSRIARGAGGAIVNVSGNSAWMGWTDHAACCASKGGLDAMSRVIANELGCAPIRGRRRAHARLPLFLPASDHGLLMAFDEMLQLGEAVADVVGKRLGRRDA